MPLPIAGIVTAVELGKRAFDVIAGFSNNASMVKASSAVQDAVNVLNAVTPLVDQFAKGRDITPDDVRIALEREGAALTEFDRVIAEKSQAAPGT